MEIINTIWFLINSLGVKICGKSQKYKFYIFLERLCILILISLTYQI